MSAATDTKEILDMRLIRLRWAYIQRIVEAVKTCDAETAERQIDFIICEWGAKAFLSGREDMARYMKECAEQFIVSDRF